MKNRQFRVIVALLVVIGLVCISLLLDIHEVVKFMNQNIVDLGRDVYQLKS